MKLCYLLTCLAVSAAAQKATVNGYVKDAATGENLIGATVLHRSSLSGTTANVHGFYSLTLKRDSCTLIYSYVGYQPVQLTFVLRRDTSININLTSAGQLEEVVVEATREEIQELTKMGSITITSDQIKALPAILGEVDVLKVIQLMPGVKSSEGSTGLYVRGGGPDQNLMLLDGVPVYNASHLFGFFSVFNADAINRVELIKGGFPARYGGRLSSVIDINMKDGNMKEFHGEGSIGLIAAKATVEGPIVKDKTSILLSARRTYLDVLTRPLMAVAIPEDVAVGYYFYDLNAKINHIVNQRNRIYLSSYLGNDRAYTKYREKFNQPDGTPRESAADSGLDWGNFITALRWNSILGPRLFSNVTATYSKYRFDIFSEYEEQDVGGGDRDYFEARYMSGIRDWAVKADLEFIPRPDHYIRFGAQTIWHQFSPGVAFSSSAIDGDTTMGARNVYATEYSVYVEDDFRLGRLIKVNAGAHASAFAVEGRWYSSLQPRLSARLLAARDFSLKASYATMTQYIHLLTNAGLGLPTDLWVPSTSRVNPQRANQVSIGAAKTYKSIYEFSIEGYYKKMSNLIEYRDGASFVSVTDNWQDNVTTGGFGEAYGTEVLIQKKSGKVTGWVGYTLSWTNRKFEELNFGKWYPYKYDRRHDISVALSHAWNDRMDFSLAWVYGTGNAVTLPIASFTGIDEPSPGQVQLWPHMRYYGERNDFRMRAYHRLDLSVGFTKKKKWGEREWVFGVYNAYSRMNPFYMDIVRKDGRQYFAQYALFPIIPSVAWNFKF
jgi:hypothetical protein